MSIFEYIKKYGEYNFDEVAFNEVDNVIFSSLSYLNYDGIVSKNSFGKKSIFDVSLKCISKYSGSKKNMTAVNNSLDIMSAIRDKKRYKDIKMYNYCYIGDENQQFSCVCFDISYDIVFVSYEGTDHLVSGWKEDFQMAYMFPILAQENAVKYINKHFRFSLKQIILGGHSKGGNLALVAGMYCNFLVRKKIINIYNNDGPGLRKAQIESSNYKNIENRLIHIIPNYSIAGLLLRHTDKYKVIKSNKMGVYAHAVVSWVVDDTCFKSSKLSTFSKILDDGMIKWLDKYDDNMRKKFVDSLFDIFKRCDINDVLDLLRNKKRIFDLIKESSDMDDDVKMMSRDFLYVIFNYFKDYEIDKLKTFGKKEG